jgi:SAM-dependent methyltransferase
MIKLLREIKDTLKTSLKHTKDIARHDALVVFGKTVKDLTAAGFPDDFKAMTILDLGCGQRFPFALQCAASGADVYALDMDYIKPDPLFIKFLKVLKVNGTKRAIKFFARRLFFDKKYYRILETSSNLPLRKSMRSIRFILADPTTSKYPLESGIFDLIASNAVLEHIKDVETFASECHRLLTAGGFLHLIVHNYYSLSGGHNLNWAFPDTDLPKHIPAWDHLRNNRFPTHVYLNKMKPDEYQEIFSKYFDIVLFQGVGKDHEAGQKEGERFLTTEIRNELRAYSEELLLTRAYLLICRKSTS